MKKIIVTAMVALLPWVTFAQEDFDKFQDKEGIDGVIISENLVEVLGYIKFSGGAEKAKPYLEKVKDVESFRVFSTSQKKYCKDMKKTVASYLKKHKMERVLNINSDGSIVDVYMVTAEDSSVIKELLLFTDNTKKDETVLVSFIGNIDLNEKTNNKVK